MCGLAGFYSRGARQHAGAEALLRSMGEAVAHRGPDGAGVWHDPSAGIGLAHRRLAILDLSAAGAQPMASASGRYVIAYNGEIYNHLELRTELADAGHHIAWRGSSDTETLVEAIALWGAATALSKCHGMFAFALWDKEERRLTLARDRLGEKPLYYGWQGEGSDATFMFASELKALKVHPRFEAVIDRDGLALLMRHGYIGGPCSIYQGIRKLEPGTLATLDTGSGEQKIETYWSLASAVSAGADEALAGDISEAVEGLDDVLGRAVRRQMISDVPVGAFLSGGVDSSVIVALMQAQSARPVRSFTIGFHEQRYDEAKHAAAVARHLGTDHTELYVTPEDALAVIPHLPAIYDEPFADPSQIPTYLIARLARTEVTVALTGDGGDELFGGYGRYGDAETLWRRMSPFPPALRAVAARALRVVPQGVWNNLTSVGQGRTAKLGDIVRRGSELLSASSAAEVYSGIASSWLRPEDVVIGGREPATWRTTASALHGNGIEAMMALDMGSYLIDDLLVKVDRAAMHVSLETRVPLLDHSVVEYAWRLPWRFKHAYGAGKYVLRELLYKYVSREIVDRPKMGFNVPLEHWLRGPLRDWAGDLLDETRLRNDGYLHPEPIGRLWRAFLRNEVNTPLPIWNVLMFQAWLRSKGG